MTTEYDEKASRRKARSEMLMMNTVVAEVYSKLAEQGIEATPQKVEEMHPTLREWRVVMHSAEKSITYRVLSYNGRLSVEEEQTRENK